MPGGEARAAGAGGRCKSPKRPETASQTAGDPRRPADLGNMSIRPAVRCGRRAAVRLLGARDGGRGAAAAAAAAAVSAESREKRSDEEERKRQHGIPELPDGRLASKTTDSCFPLIYLQREDTVKHREGRERVGVLSRTQRGAPPPLRSSACLLLLRAPGPPLAPPPDCVGVCAAADCAH